MHAYPANFWGQVGLANPITGASAAQTDEALMNATINAMKRFNIVKAIVSGPLDLVERWRVAAPDQVIGSPHFPKLLPYPELADLKRRYQQGTLAAMAETLGQYAGLTPGDPKLDPYFALAEELDIPVGLHMGLSNPGITYNLAPEYRAANGNPLLLEELVVRRPKLRVYIMHAGYPYLDETIALMWAHPQVYADVAVINWLLPRAGFHRYLQGLVDAGLGDRLMFGSDQMIWPETIEKAIEGIESAPFLSDQQKWAIFYDNAARFLRLDENVK